MACPNKETDNRIIAEIERRKGNEPKSVTVHEYSFVGDLFEVQFMGVDQSNIEVIFQTEERHWTIRMKPRYDK